MRTLDSSELTGINDGASALVLTSGKVASERGLQPVAVIRGWADAETVRIPSPLLSTAS